MHSFPFHQFFDSPSSLCLHSVFVQPSSPSQSWQVSSPQCVDTYSLFCLFVLPHLCTFSFVLRSAAEVECCGEGCIPLPMHRRPAPLCCCHSPLTPQQILTSSSPLLLLLCPPQCWHSGHLLFPAPQCRHLSHLPLPAAAFAHEEVVPGSVALELIYLKLALCQSRVHSFAFLLFAQSWDSNSAQRPT